MKITKEQKQQIINKIISEVERVGSKSALWAIFEVCGTHLEGPGDRHYLEEIAAIVTRSGKYIKKEIREPFSIGYTYQIERNPQYNTNRHIVIATWVVAVATVINLGVAILNQFSSPYVNATNSSSTHSSPTQSLPKADSGKTKRT